MFICVYYKFSFQLFSYENLFCQYLFKYLYFNKLIYGSYFSYFSFAFVYTYTYIDPLKPSDNSRHFEFDIFDKKKKKTGYLDIKLKIAKISKELPEILKNGVLELQSAKVTDLINREIMGNQDAYCVFELPSNEWIRRTNTIDAKKNAVTWDKLNLTIDIAEVLAERARNASTFKLKVKVYDENASRNDVLLGKKYIF